MPVNSQDLITSTKGVHSSAECEADWRAVCSRAYYSIYQDGEAFHNSLPAPGTLTPDSEGGRHADLIDRLIHPTLPRQHPDSLKSVSVGYMMKTVYANRIKSDYKRDKNIDKAAADNSIELILKIAEKLNIGNDFPRSQILASEDKPNSLANPESPAVKSESRGRPTLNRIK